VTGKAILSNYLWIPKRHVAGTPSEFAPEWEYSIELLRTPEGRIMQQQIAAMREQLGGGLDTDDMLKDLTTQDHMVIKNWTEVGDKWWALCLGDLKKTRALVKRLGLTLVDRRVDVPWDPKVANALKLLMTPRDYQNDAIAQWFKAGHGILKAAPAFGKAQPLDEVVLTPSGWHAIGSLKVGDSVIGSNGKPCRVTGVFPQGERPVRLVRFSDGASVRADADHLWSVTNDWDKRRGRPQRVLTTQQVQDTLREPCGQARWRVPLVEVQGEEADLPLDPYVLGVLLGDGCLAEYLASPTFTTVDEEIVQAVSAGLPEGFRCSPIKGDRAPSYRISRETGSFDERKSSVKEALKDLGLWGCLSNSKFIPILYMASSVEQRRALLCGIMDTDGWTRGSQLTTVSERLALDTVHLVRSLGGTARLSQKKTSYVYKGERRTGQVAYNVTVKLPFTPFTLTRKRAVYERRPRTLPCRRVVEVEDVGTAECVCISVDAPDNLYVTKDYVVTHNTFVMIDLIMALKQRTIVLVHTDALAEQFLTRFRYGSPLNADEEDTEYAPVTNCLEVEEKLGIEIVGRYRGPENLYPVTVATWQSFISHGGRKALKEVGKEFGHLLCDEAHVFAAPQAASVVNGFHAKRRGGATATPKRKDMLDVALFDIVGPITAHGKARQLGVVAYMIQTGIHYKGSSFQRKSEWPHMLNFLCRQADRNDLIMRWAEQDIKDGRNLLILSDRVNWCVEQAEYIRDELGVPAAAVTGGMPTAKRNKIINEMGEGRLRVICATQVFKLGVDIPVLDTLYATCPMNNAPLLQQMMGRIRRHHEGKKHPIFRYFVDEGHGLLYGCARGTHKALIEEGMDIELVADGRDPAKVMRGDARASEDGGLQKRRRGLRAAAASAPNAVTKLFADMADEARQSKRYRERMGE